MTCEVEIKVATRTRFAMALGRAVAVALSFVVGDALAHRAGWRVVMRFAGWRVAGARTWRRFGALA